VSEGPAESPGLRGAAYSEGARPPGQRPAGAAGPVTRAVPSVAAESPYRQHAATAATTAQRATPAADAAPSGGRVRGPRRARLTLTRLDAWSVFKAALVFSLCMLVVFVVVVSVLYAVLDVLGVFRAVDQTVHSVLNIKLPLSATGIIGGAAVLGLFNVILTTALVTVMAFVYNVTAALVGGLEVVLTEPE
jgi:hypothetical protein